MRHPWSLSHGGRTGEGLTSPDDHAHVIDDNDDEDSLTDSPDLRMSEGNEEDIKFVSENIGGDYSKQEAPVASVGSVGCSTPEKDFQFEGLTKGGVDTQTLSVTDWTVRLPEPVRSQVFEVCTLEDPDEWWTYQ